MWPTAYLGAFPVVLVNTSSYFKATLELSIRDPWPSFLVEGDGYGQAGDCCAGFVRESKVHHA